MNKKYKIYLDACCFNRPFDDQSQIRIFFETDIIKAILDKCQSGDWILINSDALRKELNQVESKIQSEYITKLLKISRIKVKMNKSIEARAKNLIQIFGFTLYDALHIASAETATTDVFLTTDDILFKKAQRDPQKIKVMINKPVQWIVEII